MFSVKEFWKNREDKPFHGATFFMSNKEAVAYAKKCNKEHEKTYAIVTEIENDEHGNVLELLVWKEGGIK